MPLTVEWDDGISVKCCGTRLIFDPCRNKQSPSKVFITHAHSDHSRGFSFRNSEKISTIETKEIVSTFGKKISLWEPLSIGQKLRMDDLEVVAHNAGHILGSSMYEIITPEGSVTYTGDLQFKDSFTLKGANPLPCSILITESTFGSSCFSFPDREEIAPEMVRWASKTIKDGKLPTFKADSLGNAQEITKAFNIYSDLPVVVHPRVAKVNEIYNTQDHHLSFLDERSEDASEIMSLGECVFVTPKNVDLTRHPEFEPALVSGWAVWTRKKKAFPLSDHADFGQLMGFVEACNPGTVLTCFGGRFNYSFAKQVEKQLGIEARPLDLVSTTFVL